MCWWICSSSKISSDSIGHLFNLNIESDAPWYDGRSRKGEILVFVYVLSFYGTGGYGFDPCVPSGTKAKGLFGEGIELEFKELCLLPQLEIL